MREDSDTETENIGLQGAGDQSRNNRPSWVLILALYLCSDREEIHSVEIRVFRRPKDFDTLFKRQIVYVCQEDGSIDLKDLAGKLSLPSGCLVSEPVVIRALMLHSAPRLLIRRITTQSIHGTILLNRPM